MTSLLGIGKGIEELIIAVGDFSNKLGRSIGVVAQHVTEDIGMSTNRIARTLRNVVKKVPIVGRPSAYIVKGTGKGIYYVVVLVGYTFNLVSKTTGSVLKKISKVIVFRVTIETKITTDLIDYSTNLVESVLGRTKNVLSINSLNNKRNSKKKSKRKKK